MDSDSDSPEATGAAWLPKLSINKHLERAGRPWAVIRWWLSVKMAFFIFGLCLAPSHLAAAGTILDVLQDIVDHAGRRNRRRGCGCRCGPAWSM